MILKSLSLDKENQSDWWVSVYCRVLCRASARLSPQGVVRGSVWFFIAALPMHPYPYWYRVHARASQYMYTVAHIITIFPIYFLIHCRIASCWLDSMCGLDHTVATFTYWMPKLSAVSASLDLRSIASEADRQSLCIKNYSVDCFAYSTKQ